jgi:hypothetical protein
MTWTRRDFLRRTTIGWIPTDPPDFDAAERRYREAIALATEAACSRSAIPSSSLPEHAYA